MYKIKVLKFPSNLSLIVLARCFCCGSLVMHVVDGLRVCLCVCVWSPAVWSHVVDGVCVFGLQRCGRLCRGCPLCVPFGSS